MPTASDELRALCTSLVGRASEQAERGVGASFDQRIASSIDLAERGEQGVALENLAQNIYEFEVPLSRLEYLEIERIGIGAGLAPDAWTFLESLIH